MTAVVVVLINHSSKLQGFPESSVGKESACNAGDSGSIPRSGRSTGEGIGYPLQFLGLPLWLSWSRIHLQCGKPGFDPWVEKIPWRKERLPTPVSWPGEFHGLYSPWTRKESDMTELSLFVKQSPWIKSNKLSLNFRDMRQVKELMNIMFFLPQVLRQFVMQH